MVGDRAKIGHEYKPSMSLQLNDGAVNKIRSSAPNRNKIMEEEKRSLVAGRNFNRSRPRRAQAAAMKKTGALLSIFATLPSAMAASCISLSGSSQCSAFNASSISTDTSLVALFPFLSSVTDTATFDSQLAAYVSTSYIQSKYESLLGCSGIELTNTTNLYARWTTTVICNSIVQNSITPCSLSSANSRPVCADTCSEFAESEDYIISDSALCTNPSSNAQSQIRADFTNCALPASSLDTTCIEGVNNEPDNCGYGTSVVGFCSYCASGTVNSTDTCCYNSQAETRCAGVVLPSITATISLVTSTASATSSPTSASSSTAAAASKSGSHLSGGDVAGIVIGSIAGLALLIGLIVLLTICFRRRRGSQQGSVFNHPTPPRQATGSGMTYNPAGGSSNSPAAPAGYEVLPGGRIARMSALEGHSNSPPRGEMAAIGAGGAAAGAGAAYAAGRRRHHEQSSSSEFGDSPESDVRGGILRPPPTGKRNGSLSSGSALGAEDPNSPQSGSGGMSSPLGLGSQQSEQLAYFKDYYSQDEIHPGDKVATLWAYQPRAGDEFALERGDMLKVVGIWDDGWATGMLIDERADDWEATRNPQRDSGVSNGSGAHRESSSTVTGEIKAFPLVCVCLPQHWRKTIEGDGSTETGSSGPPPHS